MTKQSIEFGVLVAGSGSIGRRHMRNLRALGIQRDAARHVTGQVIKVDAGQHL